MKKRLLCMFLCLVMMLSVVLTACGKKTDKDAEENISDAASETAMTLTMWVVSEEKVSDATAAMVSEALNAITKAKFKTQLVLKYFTEDEYEARLTETIKAYEAEKATQTTAPKDTATGSETEKVTATAPIEDETETNEYGMSIIKYPELVRNQVDIIYIAGEDMYLDFIENNWLAQLDVELTSASKKINEFVASTLMDSVKYNGKTFAVPNNRPIGEYTFMMLNKELMDKYGQQGYINTNQIDGFYDDEIFSFLNLINAVENKESDKVVPLDTTFEECLELLAYYWAFDPYTYEQLEKFSIFGHHYKTEEELSRGSVSLGFGSLFADDEFIADYMKLRDMDFKGMFGDAKAEKKQAAITFMEGDYSVLMEYEAKGYYTADDGQKYYPIVAKYPTASTEDIFGNMFGVYTGTRSLARSMEIVTYLNTNADFRNILQYGVENVNYTLETDVNGKVTLSYTKNNDYHMDVFATGNVFIAYQDPNISGDVWTAGKIQNRYSLVDPVLGFDFVEFSKTTAKAPAAVSIPSKIGYLMESYAGLSKEVVSQDPTLAAWLEKCDQAADGVYIMRSGETEGSITTYNYYVYNKGVSANATFYVDVVREMEEETNAAGEVNQVQKSLDFYFNYVDGETAPSTGCELSLVTIRVKKNGSFNVNVKVNDAAVTPTVESNDKGLLKVDMLKTEHYSIDLYPTLSKTVFEEQRVVMDWIESVDRSTTKLKTPTTYMIYYEKTNEEGKKETAFAFYHTGLKYVTEVKVQPVKTEKGLELVLHYYYDESATLDAATEATYVLSYANVTTDSTIENITYSNVNHVTAVVVNEETPLITNYTERVAVDTTPFMSESADADPEYHPCGNLDIYSLKTIAALNDALVAKLEACQDMESLEALIAEMKVFLDVEDKHPAKMEDFELLSDLAAKYCRLDPEGNETLYNIHRLIRDYANPDKKEYEICGEDPNNGAEVWNQVQYIDVTTRGLAEAKWKTEPYVYFDTPYQIYYKWQSAYGYLPPEPETETTPAA